MWQPLRKLWCLIGFLLVGVVARPTSDQAATTTATFNSRIVIQSQCIIATTNTLDFGTTGVITSAINQTTTLSIQCTNGTSFNIGLDSGTSTGATTTIRKLATGGNLINYQMFQDSARSINWGNAVGTDTVSGVGTGATATFTVYGQVPLQLTPVPGTYTDLVTITVTY